MTKRLVCGVDGGGTKTIALVGDTAGRIVGAGRGGNSCIYRAGSPDEAIDQIETALAEALVQAGATSNDVAAAGLALAGADWPEDFDFLRERIGPLVPRARLVIANDAMGALRAGTDDGVGACVIAGTGANVAARGRDGRGWHASFWLPVPSGATILARDALFAAVADVLGIGPPTKITERMPTALGFPDVEAILHAHTSRRARPYVSLAPFAEVVLDLAGDGDDVAREIVQRLGGVLGAYAGAAARRVHLEPGFPLVLAGGLFRHRTALFPDAVVAAVGAATTVTWPSAEPAVGAFLIGLDQVTDAMPARAVTGAPAASYYAT